jgi:hypothetical protein
MRRRALSIVVFVRRPRLAAFLDQKPHDRKAPSTSCARIRLGQNGSLGSLVTPRWSKADSNRRSHFKAVAPEPLCDLSLLGGYRALFNELFASS